MPFDLDDPRLTAFALGELDPAERAAIEAILRDDPDCRAFIHGIEDTARLLSNELRHESTATNGLAPSHMETIEAQLAVPTLSMPDIPAKPSRRGLRVIEIAIAASMIGVVIGLLLPGVQGSRRKGRLHTELAQADSIAIGSKAWGENSAAARSGKVADGEKGKKIRYLRDGEVLSATDDTVEYRVAAPGQVIAPNDYAFPGPSAPVASAPTATTLTAGLDGKPLQDRLSRSSIALGESPGAYGFAKSATPESELRQATGNARTSGEKLAAVNRTSPAKVDPAGQAPSKPGDSRFGLIARRGTVETNTPFRTQGGLGPGGGTMNKSAMMPVTNGGVAVGGGQLGGGGMGGGIGGGMGEPVTTSNGALALKKDGSQRDLQVPRSGDTKGELAKSLASADHGYSKSDFNGSLGVPVIQGSASLTTPFNAGANGPAVAGDQLASRKAPPALPQVELKGEMGPKIMVVEENMASGLKNGQVGPSNRGDSQKSDLGGNVSQLSEKAPSDMKRNGFIAGANQVGQPAAAAKPAEPQNRLALNDAKNNVNDFDRREVDALALDVANKQAELQRLQVQAEGFRQRAAQEKFKVDREAYARLYDNSFTNVVPGVQLSTFAVDVDTASYANVRRFLVQGQLPPVDAVRIEEMVNAFSYDDPAPTGGDPFSVNVEVAACPWDGSHRLARIGLKGKTIANDKRPMSNLVFLIDTSGSMADINKLPFLKAGMKLLVEQLTENDRVGIVTYSNEVRVALPSTPCHRKDQILAVLDGLKAEGGTNGGAGVQMAYKMAQDNFIKGGTNRVILATDGDFNLGLTKEELLATCADRAKGGVFLSVLGFGQGNIQEDFMEQLADKGNGNYSYIDNIDEARKVLVTRMSGTLVVIAKDVKVQVEFNPDKVSAYRLIGYENRVMANEDFRNDKKDAGEIGAGHSVTALYEIVPNAAVTKVAVADRPLKYKQATRGPSNDVSTDKAKDVAQGVNAELLTVYLRYKQPDGETATEISKGVTDDGREFGRASTNLKFSAAVAGFGMLLRESPYKGTITYPAVLEIATSAIGDDRSNDRKEFLELVKQAERLSPQ